MLTKTIVLLSAALAFTTCNAPLPKAKAASIPQEKKLQNLAVAEEINSQYAIESNTMIFYDQSISDAIKSRKFYRCLDVFTAEVYAKITRSATDILNVRVLSFIYDESQVLNFDLRQDFNLSPLDFHIMGYIINSETGNSILDIFKPHESHKIELFVKDLKTDFGTIAGMLNDSRNVVADQIVNKKDNVGTIPFRRMNVFNANVLARDVINNRLLRVVDIYRPAQLYRSFNNPPLGSQASWFATAFAVSNDGKVASGSLVYLKNPRIVEE